MIRMRPPDATHIKICNEINSFWNICLVRQSHLLNRNRKRARKFVAENVLDFQFFDVSAVQYRQFLLTLSASGVSCERSELSVLEFGEIFRWTDYPFLRIHPPDLGSSGWPPESKTRMCCGFWPAFGCCAFKCCSTFQAISLLSHLFSFFQMQQDKFITCFKYCDKI